MADPERQVQREAADIRVQRGLPRTGVDRVRRVVNDRADAELRRVHRGHEPHTGRHVGEVGAQRFHVAVCVEPLCVVDVLRLEAHAQHPARYDPGVGELRSRRSGRADGKDGNDGHYGSVNAAQRYRRCRRMGRGGWARHRWRQSTAKREAHQGEPPACRLSEIAPSLRLRDIGAVRRVDQRDQPLGDTLV